MVATSEGPSGSSDRSAYQLPVVGLRVPYRVGNTAFWAGLAGAVVIGAVELPLAGLLGAGVVVARRGRRRPAAD
jgi:hypothetical protein